MLAVVLVVALVVVAAIAVAGWLLSRARTGIPPQPRPQCGTRRRDPHETRSGRITSRHQSRTTIDPATAHMERRERRTGRNAPGCRACPSASVLLARAARTRLG